MENFDEKNHSRLKERNVYLLHLDTPRIIIISSVLIGLVLVAFLFGMNMKKKNNTVSDIASLNDPFLQAPIDGKNKDAILEGNLDQPLTDKDLTLKSPENDSTKKTDDKGIVQYDNKNQTPDLGMKEPGDVHVINSDTINDIIPAAKAVTKPAHDKIVKKEKKKKNRKRAKINKRKKKSRKKQVVEVASSEKNSSSYNSDRAHYTIQIASLDKKSRASKEKRNLKSMRYDAHVNSTKINGKKYYRVRIGPIYSKRKAIKILNELQENSKYEGSYMIKE